LARNHQELIDMTIRTTSHHRRVLNRQGGFTLVELLIVVFIISVLSMIAYSSYQDSLVRTRRNAALGCLLENSQFMERFYTTNLRYDQTLAGAAVPAPTCASGRDVTDFYTVSFVGVPTQTTFALQAVPTAVQADKDTKCATLGINQTGTKTKSGTGTLDECW
jgi:type IV pilus assembly protein PilE